MDGTVLVADDDRTIRTVLTQAFTRAGCKVHATSSLTTLLRWVEEGRGDLVVTDVMMPDGNGLEMLPRIRKLRHDLPVIVISAQNTIMTAIQAAEAEAYDYMPKPFDLPDLMKRAARALEQPRQVAGRNAEARSGDELPLIGRTPVMQELYRLVARILNTDLPVLIAGESGTGKSLIARVIHDFSDRRSLPFVVAGAAELEDIGALHEIISRAGSGVLLLEELSDLTPTMQARLVRSLDSLGDNAPRLLATTQADLSQLVEDGAFRADLYYRLSVVSLDVPPLRARVDDIAPLARHFLAQLDLDQGGDKILSEEALEQMRKYVWPGNVRQLENTVRRLALTCPQREITGADFLAVPGLSDQRLGTLQRSGGEKLSDSIRAHLQRYFDLHGETLPPSGLYARILREMERPLIEISLEASGGNQAKCADLLGINRNTLRKKIAELDIEVTRRRKLV